MSLEKGFSRPSLVVFLPAVYLTSSKTKAENTTGASQVWIHMNTKKTNQCTSHLLWEK